MKVVIAGAGGKMGRSLIDGVAADKALSLGAAFDVGDDAEKAIAAGDLLIDFTRPEGRCTLAACRKLGKAMVIGTTGFSAADKEKIAAAAKSIPIVLSPNFAVGVNAVFKLAETAARILGDDFDVEIVEAHHRHKVDAPSGTALRLGEIVASALKRDLKSEARHGREGDTGARTAKEIVSRVARRRHRGRAHRDVRGRGRARRGHGAVSKQDDLRPGRAAGGQISPGEKAGAPIPWRTCWD